MVSMLHTHTYDMINEIMNSTLSLHLALHLLLSDHLTVDDFDRIGLVGLCINGILHCVSNRLREQREKESDIWFAHRLSSRTRHTSLSRKDLDPKCRSGILFMKPLPSLPSHLILMNYPLRMCPCRGSFPAGIFRLACLTFLSAITNKLGL